MTFAARTGFGGAGITVAIVNQPVNATQAGGNASATYSLRNDGIIRTFENGSSIDVGFWITPQSGFAGYETRATYVSGAGGTFTGTLGAWTNLAATQTWSLSTTIVSTVSRVLTIEISPAGVGVAITTATITLNATREP